MRCHPASVPALGLLALFSSLAAAREPLGANALEKFRARHGAGFVATLDPIRERPTFYFGAAIETGKRPRTDAEFESAARALLARDQDLLGLEGSELVDARVMHLALSRAGSSDKVAVKFRQAVGGVPVFDGTLTVLFDAKSGRIIALDHVGVAGAGAVDLAPKIGVAPAARAAELAFVTATGIPAAHATDVEPVITGPSPLFGWKSPATDRGPELAWQVTIEGVGRDADNLPARGRVLVSADEDLAILWVENAVRTATNGSTKANVNVDLDPANAGNLELRALSSVDIHTGSPTGTVVATTDANGNFSIANNGPVTLYAALTGPFFNVIPVQGTALTLSLVGSSGSPANFVFNTSLTEFDIAQVEEAWFIARFRDFIRADDPSDVTFDFPVTAYVNIPAACNAYFDGDSLNFFNASSGCANTAYSTVSHHEQGHYANQQYNDAMTGSLHEGLADAWAYYISDQPCLAIDFFGPGSGCLRNGVNGYTFCGNGNDNCYGEVHASGNVIAGAMWVMRTNLQTALGAGPGGIAANALMLDLFRAFNDSSISTSINDHLVALDDDDANLLNGTPHKAQIDGAFTSKGFPGSVIPDLSVVAVNGPMNGVAIPSGYGPPITAQIHSALGSVSSATLHWSQNNGSSWSTTAMAPTGAFETWGANGPALVAPKNVRWYVTATSSGGDSITTPSQAPDPDFNLYHVGAVTVLASFDFETPDGSDQGWTHALLSGTADPDADDWARKAPGSTAPSDPPAAFSGTRCWGNDLGGTVSGIVLDGRYKKSISNRLLSPVFNCSTASNVRLQFRRWLACEDGGYDPAQIFVNGNLVYQNFTTPGGGDHQTIDTSWVQQDIDISGIAAANPSVQIEFRITSDSGLQFGGWQIDDLRLARIEAGSGAFLSYGAGCAGTGGLVPALSGIGIPSPGGGVGVAITNGKASGTGLLFLGTAQVSIPTQQCTFLVGGSVPPPTALPLSAAGALTLISTIPQSTPSLTQIYMQWIGIDSGSVNATFSASNGLRMTIQ